MINDQQENIQHRQTWFPQKWNSFQHEFGSEAKIRLIKIFQEEETTIQRIKQSYCSFQPLSQKTEERIKTRTAKEAHFDACPLISLAVVRMKISFQFTYTKNLKIFGTEL